MNEREIRALVHEVSRQARRETVDKIQGDMRNMKNSIGLVSVSVAAVFAFVGCGGSGSGSGSNGSGLSGDSLESISNAIASPTGTVSADAAPEIARAFEESQGIPTGAERDGGKVITAQDFAYECDGGGSIDFNFSDDGLQSEFIYNRCCVLADCCIDGTGSTFSEEAGSLSYCSAFNIDYDCGGENFSLNYASCVDEDFNITYAIEIEGETFAVSGSLFNGTGSLTITGVNGSWSCEYTEYSGSCASGDGETFEF